MLRVHVTKHAIERLFERFPKRKFEANVVLNTIENIIKSGTVVLWKNEIRISTNRYTLCCVFKNNSKNTLIIKTILKTKELGGRYKRLMKYGKKSPWNAIYFENRDQVKRWCSRIKEMQKLCKICGISREQTAIERCGIYGFYICSFCCASVGGYSEKCRGCTFDIYEAVIRYLKKIKNDDYIIFI